MKRYEIAHRYIGGFGVDEDPDGVWVKWSDIEKLRSKLIEEFSINVAQGKKAWTKKLFSELS